MARAPTCPSCKRPTDLGTSNPNRPFCCERCRLIDLGDWLSEKHAIPADEPPDAEPETQA